MKPQKRELLVFMVLWLGCHKTGLDSNWSAWFSHEVTQLPARSAPQSLGVETVSARTPDGVVFRLEGDYRKRNEYGCWSRHQSAHPTPEWRDVCLHRVSLGKDSLPGFTLKPALSDPRAADLHQSNAWDAGSMLLGAHRAIVERALVSGGIEGLRNQPAIAVLIEVGSHDLVLVEGHVGDEAGYDDILRIAGTVDVAN